MKRSHLAHGKLLEGVLKRIFGSAAEARKLNGERALQCLMYKTFLDEALGPYRQLLVEPRINSDGGDGTSHHKRPDLILATNRDASGDGLIDICLELKFLPWGHAEFERDIEKLSGYMRAAKLELRYEFDPAQGTRACLREYRADQETLWAFVAVGQDTSAVASPESMVTQLSKRVAEGRISRATTWDRMTAACFVAAGTIDKKAPNGPKFWIADLGNPRSAKVFPVG